MSRPTLRPPPGAAPPARPPPRAAVAAAGPSTSTADRATALVDALIAAAADTDRGSAAPPGARQRFDGAFDALLAATAESVKTAPPLASPALWGDWDVAFVGVGARQAGQPAGGRFRSGGVARRWLFASTSVRQALYPPPAPGAAPVCVNRVGFKLGGSAVRGHVALRGDATPVEGGDGGATTVRVVFDPPVLALAPGTPFATGLRLGGQSWVQLATPFVDERVRLGVGSLGSRFLFTRAPVDDDGEAATPAAAAVTTAPLGWVALAALAAGLAAATWGVAAKAPGVAKAAAIVPALLFGAVVAAVGKDRAVTWFPGEGVEAPREKRQDCGE